MPYPYSPYPVTGGQIRAAAEDTSGRLESVRTVVGQVESEHRGAISGVEGDLEGSVADAIDPMRQSASAVEKSAFYAAGCLEFFGHAVDIYNTDGVSPRSVEKLNSDWEALVASSFGVSRESLPSDATQEQREAANGRFNSAVSSARAAEQREFDAEFERLETNLDEAATETQGKLNRGPNKADILDLYSAGALPVFAALIWSDIDFSNQYLPPEQAQELARYIADQVEKGDIDATTVRLMSLYQDNADFSAEFYRHVTPDEMTNAIVELSSDAFPYGNPADPYSLSEERELYRNFLVAAGTMLATYSNGVGDNRPPDDFAEQWGNAITSEDPEDQANAAALSMLFKHGQDGGFDGDFLAEVTEIVYEYEVNHPDDGPIWGPRAGTDSSTMYGPQDPFKEGDLIFGGYSYDPLANLFTAMDESPEAAEIFVGNAGTTEYDDTGAMVNDRLHYLLMERIWPTDNGDGLGQALQGATTHSRNDDASGQQSAALASQLVHLIANEAGDEDSGFWEDGWRIPEGMRDSVGNIAASYVSDIYRIAQNDSGDPTDLTDWVYGDNASENAYNDIFGLRASNSDMATFLQEIGRGDDKSGITAVTTAALMHNNDLTSSYLETYNEEHPNAPLTIDDLRENGVLNLLEDQSSRTGTALDFIVQNGIDGGHGQEADNAARQEVFSKAFSVATDFVPTPAGKVAGMLTSEGLSWLNDQVSNVPDSVTDKWADDTHGQMLLNLEYQTYNALVDNGYLDVERDPAYGLPHGAVVFSNGEWQINPALYNSDPADAPAALQNAFNDWQDGPDPNDPSDDRNGSPNDLFQDYLNALASRVAEY
jgi:hypothetical protein